MSTTTEARTPGAQNKTAQANPFASHRVDGLGYRFIDEDWDSALERLAGLGYRAAITGPEGKGKTTLLFELERRLREHGHRVRLERLAPLGIEGELAAEALPGTPQPSADYEFVDPRSCASAVDSEEILLIDSAGLLTPPERLRLRFVARKAKGLIVTSHEDIWLPTWVTCCTTREQFLLLVEELIGHSITGVKPHLDQIFEKHDGNVRSAFRELYDRFAEPKLEDPFGVCS
jgi:hypothetical protein